MSSPREVAALCVRSDSIYKLLPGVVAWEKGHDIRRFGGDMPIVAHPPCRAWGRLRKQAKPAPGEKELGLLAVQLVRRNGGVLEHPTASTLWREAGLPRPGEAADAWGGYTIQVLQFWFGHRAEKSTWLYIVGVPQEKLPHIQLPLGDAPRVIATHIRVSQGGRSEVTDREKEATPPQFADWLIEVARRSRVQS